MICPDPRRIIVFIKGGGGGVSEKCPLSNGKK